DDLVTGVQTCALPISARCTLSGGELESIASNPPRRARRSAAARARRDHPTYESGISHQSLSLRSPEKARVERRPDAPRVSPSQAESALPPRTRITSVARGTPASRLSSDTQ